jgi:MinD superfamily P-loop ATPase
MIVSIASGKGGTGKTTIAANLAIALGSKVQLLDCDVEEPNAHLFLNPEMVGRKTVFSWVPEVNHKLCNLCGKCAKICRFSAITLVGKTILTFPQLCHDCGGCKLVCPAAAIEDGKRELGEIEQGHRNGISFYHGRLRVGEAMSPPLIKQVRVFARPGWNTIIDAPPGTSCPVITAIKGVDFVLLVTEPTPFGLHDLKLAVEAVKSLGIPCGLVINRCDIGDDQVIRYAEQEQIPILMQIPFDRQIAELYAKGKLVSEGDLAWQNKFLALFRSIESVVANREKNK